MDQVDNESEHVTHKETSQQQKRTAADANTVSILILGIRYDDTIINLQVKEKPKGKSNQNRKQTKTYVQVAIYETHSGM